MASGLSVGLAMVGASRGEEPPLATYFRAETERIAARPLLGIRSAEEWVARRPELRRRLVEMLDMPQALALLHPRPVSLVDTSPDVRYRATELRKAIGGGR